MLKVHPCCQKLEFTPLVMKSRYRYRQGPPDPDWFYQRHSGLLRGDLRIVYPVDFFWQLPLKTKPRRSFDKKYK